MKIEHSPGPWQCYLPSEQERIHREAPQYAPKGQIWRISGTTKSSRYIGLLFRSHPNEPDPIEADVRLMTLAPTAPHECSDPQCPGNVNRLKLKAAKKMAECLRVWGYVVTDPERRVNPLTDIEFGQTSGLKEYNAAIANAEEIEDGG